MPGFVYKAIGPDGKERKGNIQATSEEQAFARIKGDGLIPIEVTPETLLTKDINIPKPNAVPLIWITSFIKFFR